MKKTHSHEARLIDRPVHGREVVYRGDSATGVKLRNKRIVLVAGNGVLLIKDLEWKTVEP